MSFGCQTCLRVIGDPSEGLYINNTLGFDAISLKEKLLECVPELILDSVPDPILCHPCVENLRVAFEFKQKCLDTQQKIYGFLQQAPDSTSINTEIIAVHYQRLELVAQGIAPPITDLPFKINHPQLPLICKYCNFACLDKCVVRQHEIMHLNKDPPYKCDLCELDFSSTISLLDHLATHFNEKPYACTICDYTTDVCKNLKIHGWSHRRPFQCNICWNRYADKHELEEHVKIHDEREPGRFQCGWCDFNNDKLKFLGTHHYEQHLHTVKCKLCKLHCRTELGLKEHMDSAHKDTQISVLTTKSAPLGISPAVSAPQSPSLPKVVSQLVSKPISKSLEASTAILGLPSASNRVPVSPNSVTTTQGLGTPLPGSPLVSKPVSDNFGASNPIPVSNQAPVSSNSVFPSLGATTPIPVLQSVSNRVPVLPTSSTTTTLGLSTPLPVSNSRPVPASKSIPVLHKDKTHQPKFKKKRGKEYRVKIFMAGGGSIRMNKNVAIAKGIWPPKENNQG